MHVVTRVSWRTFVGAVALAAAAWGAAGADRVEAAGVTFGGLNSQQRPIVVEVSPLRRRVTRVLWDWEGTCVLGSAGTSETPLIRRASDRTTPEVFSINRSGRWSGRYSAGPFPVGETGNTETFSYKLTGRFLAAGARMAGTIRVTYTEATAAGDLIRTCRSGLITYDLKD